MIMKTVTRKKKDVVQAIREEGNYVQARDAEGGSNCNYLYGDKMAKPSALLPQRSEDFVAIAGHRPLALLNKHSTAAIRKRALKRVATATTPLLQASPVYREQVRLNHVSKPKDSRWLARMLSGLPQAQAGTLNKLKSVTVDRCSSNCFKHDIKQQVRANPLLKPTVAFMAAEKPKLLPKSQAVIAAVQQLPLRRKSNQETQAQSKDTHFGSTANNLHRVATPVQACFGPPYIPLRSRHRTVISANNLMTNLNGYMPALSVDLKPLPQQQSSLPQPAIVPIVSSEPRNGLLPPRVKAHVDNVLGLDMSDVSGIKEVEKPEDSVEINHDLAVFLAVPDSGLKLHHVALAERRGHELRPPPKRNVISEQHMHGQRTEAG